MLMVDNCLQRCHLYDNLVMPLKVIKQTALNQGKTILPQEVIKRHFHKIYMLLNQSYFLGMGL